MTPDTSAARVERHLLVIRQHIGPGVCADPKARGADCEGGRCLCVDDLNDAIEALAKDAERMAERGWCDDDIAPALRALAAERDRLESALQTERGKLEAADAANDALARDAARYRWLKNSAEARDNDEAAEFHGEWPYAVHLLISDDDGSMAYESGFGTDAIDAAIDAAMKGRA